MIDTTTVFNKLSIISGTTEGAGVSGANLFQNDAPVFVEIPRPWVVSNTQVLEIIARVKLGTCAVEYSVYEEGGSSVYPYNSLPEHLKFLHFQHPFHPNDGYLIPDALRRHGDLSHSDVGGRPRITGTFDEVPEDYETGTPVTQALNDWRVREYSATRFEFIHNPPESEDLTDAAYNAYSPARAMAVWLESIRTAGPAVGSDLNDILSYSGARRYTWDQGVGAGALVFRADQAGQTTENGHIVEFGIIFERVTGIFNRSRFAVQLATATITLSGSTQTQKPVRGSYSNPHRVSRVEFSDHHWKEIIAGQPITVTRLPGSDEAVYIPDGAVGIIQFEDLPANPNGVKLLPSYTQAPMVGAMHSQGSTAGRVVMLQPPPNMVEYPGALRPFRVHNLDAAYNLAVKFWDGTFVIVLQPGEHIHLQFSANRDGTGFVIGEAPDRHHRASGAALGDFATRGILAGRE